jgi:hypothetical protein
MNARIRTAEQSIFHDGARLSYLDLPVVDRQATAHER